MDLQIKGAMVTTKNRSFLNAVIGVSERTIEKNAPSPTIKHTCRPRLVVSMT